MPDRETAVPDRLAALADGIFAIAMTLLVLNITVGGSAGRHPGSAHSTHPGGLTARGPTAGGRALCGPLANSLICPDRMRRYVT